MTIVVIFGMFRPFNDDSVEAIFNNIKRGHIEWPDLGNACVF